jgi:hypothetical protein
MTLRAPVAAVVLGLLTLAACGPASRGGDPTPDNIQSIEVTPAEVTLEIADGASASQGYTARAILDDGSAVDVTDQVSWSLDRIDVGAFSGTTFTASGSGAGRAEVHANLGGKLGVGVVFIDVSHNELLAGVDPATPGRFDGASDATGGLTLRYPEPETVLPPNLGSLDVQWTGSSSVYEIAIDAEYAHLRVYSLPTTPANAIKVAAADWGLVARAAANATATLTVRGLSDGSTTAVSTPPATLHVSADAVHGGLYYWSVATNVQGVLRADFDATTTTGESFYTANETGGACIGCHTVSRDGRRMVAVEYGPDGLTTVIDVATRTPKFALGTVEISYSTFAPDGLTFIGTLASGVMAVYDSDTGQTLGQVPTGDQFGTQPDWSPDGTKVVWSSYSAGGSLWFYDGGQLYVTDVSGGLSFGSPRLLVTPPSGKRAYYPTFSPDNQWVLYNVSSGDSYDNTDAELWVIKADGSGQPIRLATANQVANLTNSWARWAPFAGQADGAPIFWFTVSSRRPVGLLGQGNPQVWMAAFYPDKAQAGQDPASPLFWLPFQDLASPNHIAQWTQMVVPIE